MTREDRLCPVCFKPLDDAWTAHAYGCTWSDEKPQRPAAPPHTQWGWNHRMRP